MKELNNNIYVQGYIHNILLLLRIYILLSLLILFASTFIIVQSTNIGRCCLFLLNIFSLYINIIINIDNNNLTTARSFQVVFHHDTVLFIPIYHISCSDPENSYFIRYFFSSTIKEKNRPRSFAEVRKKVSPMVNEISDPIKIKSFRLRTDEHFFLLLYH